MTRTAKMHFTAEVNEESGEIGMSVEWNTSIKIAVEVLFGAAIKHHQIRTVIEMVHHALEQEAPLSDEERKHQMMSVILENMVSEDPEAEKILQKFMANQKPKGDA